MYDEWLAKNPNKAKLKNYVDYSIGFLTRGCFRHCAFCVNRRSSSVRVHSPLEEFLDTSRKKICLLDDNFFGCAEWKKLLQKLLDTQKPFHFKQGLDVRLLDEEKAEMIFSAKYDGDFIFAFDDFKDAPLIEKKLQLIRRYTNKRIKFYVLCGYDRQGKHDEKFFVNDIEETFKRIDLLRKYDALPYIMRHKNYQLSEFRGIYITLAEWCNIPAVFRETTFREFCHAREDVPSRNRYLKNYESKFPVMKKFFDTK